MIFNLKSTSGHIYNETIDIDELGELLDLYNEHNSKTHDNDLIRDAEIIITKIDGRWTIEIYDDYRE